MALGMFLVTFLMGYLPTKLKTSQRVMNLIAIYGAGLLVGAALIVIVPEGMMVLFSSFIKDPTEIDLAQAANVTSNTLILKNQMLPGSEFQRTIVSMHEN